MKKVIALLLLSNAFVYAQKKEFDTKDLKADRTPKNFQQLYSGLMVISYLLCRETEATKALCWI